MANVPQLLPATITIIATIRYLNGMETTSRAPFNIDVDNLRQVTLLRRLLTYVIGTGWVLRATLPAPCSPESLEDIESIPWVLYSDQSPDADYAFEPAWVIDGMCAAYEPAWAALGTRRKVQARVMAEIAIAAIDVQITYIRDGRRTGLDPYREESPDWLVVNFPYTTSLVRSAHALGDMILDGWAQYGDGEPIDYNP